MPGMDVDRMDFQVETGTLRTGTEVVRVTRDRLTAADLERCVAVLEQGHVIAFPTDTVYGLACNAFSLNGVKRIYELKGRTYNKPLPVLLSDRNQLTLVAKEIPPEANVLMDRFWPGALTLV